MLEFGQTKRPEVFHHFRPDPGTGALVPASELYLALHALVHLTRALFIVWSVDYERECIS